MIKDFVEVYFTEQGIPDIYASALLNVEYPEYISNDEFEELIKSVRITFIKTIQTYLLIMSEINKIDPDLQIAFLQINHESIIRYISSYYSKLQELVDAFIDYEKYSDAHEYFDCEYKKNKLSKVQMIYFNYLYKNDFTEIINRIDLGDLKILNFYTKQSAFAFENKDGARAYIPNINLLDENQLIDPRKYFFYEIISMILVFQTFAATFKQTDDVELNSFLTDIQNQFIYFEKLNDIIQYSREFISLDFFHE